MVGYDEVVETTVDTVELQPYNHYRTLLADLEGTDTAKLDERWSAEHVSAFARFPWVYVRTGLVAVPTAAVCGHGLLFDEGFRGWGPEDQEWGLRVAQTGMPIVLGTNMFGLHLPHLRDNVANGATAMVNNRYYLAKWPRLELELALAFGWLEADRSYADVERELAEATAGAGSLGVLRGTVGGTDLVVVGAVLDNGSVVPCPELKSLFGNGSPLEVLPLAGFALPYQDGAVDECRILPTVFRLSARSRDAIVREAERVARRVTTPGTWLASDDEQFGRELAGQADAG
jgi:hypothetical protein